MICFTCGVAGDLIKVSRTIDPIYVTGEHGYRGRDMVSTAHFLHNRCDNKCDCQHVIDTEGKMTGG